MSKTLCGLDCAECPMKSTCAGCEQTCGKPFGGECIVAVCCQRGTCEYSGSCFSSPCPLKERLCAEFNALGIADMETVADLNALCGAYINLEYTLPNGARVKLLDDKKVYFGNQLHKKGSDRYYGVIADEGFIAVCDYADGGADAHLLLYKSLEK